MWTAESPTSWASQIISLLQAGVQAGAAGQCARHPVGVAQALQCPDTGACHYVFVCWFVPLADGHFTGGFPSCRMSVADAPPGLQLIHISHLHTQVVAAASHSAARADAAAHDKAGDTAAAQVQRRALGVQQPEAVSGHDPAATCHSFQGAVMSLHPKTAFEESRNETRKSTRYILVSQAALEEAGHGEQRLAVSASTLLAQVAHERQSKKVTTTVSNPLGRSLIILMADACNQRLAVSASALLALLAHERQSKKVTATSLLLIGI